MYYYILYVTFVPFFFFIRLCKNTGLHSFYGCAFVKRFNPHVKAVLSHILTLINHFLCSSDGICVYVVTGESFVSLWCQENRSCKILCLDPTVISELHTCFWDIIEFVLRMREKTLNRISPLVNLRPYAWEMFECSWRLLKAPHWQLLWHTLSLQRLSAFPHDFPDLTTFGKANPTAESTLRGRGLGWFSQQNQKVRL